MPQFEVEVDGKRYVLEGSHPPTESEARSAVGSSATSTPSALPDFIRQQILMAPLTALRGVTQASIGGFDPRNPFGITTQAARIPQPALETALPIAGGFAGSRFGLPGVSAGAGIGTMLARSIGKARKDTGEPLTLDGFSQSAKEVLGAGAATAAGTLVVGTGMSLAGKGLGALFGQRGLLTGALGRQHRLFQIQKDRLVSGFRQQTQQATLQRDAALKTAREQSAAALQGVATGTKQQLAALTAEQEAVHRSMQEVAEQSVLKVREVFPGVAKRTSEQYRALVDDAVKGLDDVEVPFSQLITTLHNRMGADPEIFGLALKRLGLSEDLAAVLTKVGPAGVEGPSRGQSGTLKKILHPNW